MLEDYTDQLGKYKELRAKGLSKDDAYENILNAKKQVITEVLEFITR